MSDLFVSTEQMVTTIRRVANEQKGWRVTTIQILFEAANELERLLNENALLRAQAEGAVGQLLDVQQDCVRLRTLLTRHHISSNTLLGAFNCDCNAYDGQGDIHKASCYLNPLTRGSTGS